MSIMTTLKKTHLPVFYSHAPELTQPPYLIYMGNGQNTFKADDTIYHRENTYRVEYYFRKKDEAMEAAIEDNFLADGYIYSKSEDTYIDDEGVYVIYYTV